MRQWGGRLFAFFAPLTVLIGIGATLLWVRSVWLLDEVNVSFGSRTWRLCSDPQRLSFISVPRIGPGQAPYGGLGQRHEIPLKLEQLWFDRGGGDLATGSPVWWIAIPCWVFVVPALTTISVLVAGHARTKGMRKMSEPE